MWAAYEGLDKIEGMNYTHKTVNHSQRGIGRFVNPETGAHTQAIEGSWKHLKYDLTDSGYKQEDLAMHMCAYLWHREVRQKKLDPFEQLWSDIKTVYPIPDTGF